jgi:hypothetical protein
VPEQLTFFPGGLVRGDALQDEGMIHDTQQSDEMQKEMSGCLIQIRGDRLMSEGRPVV